MAFLHIPPRELLYMVNRENIYGNKYDTLGCPLFDTPFFEKLVEAKFDSVYYGHDHNNDFIGKYEGVEMVFGRKSGYGGYGPPEFMKRGARVIELTEKKVEGSIEVKKKNWII